MICMGVHGLLYHVVIIYIYTFIIRYTLSYVSCASSSPAATEFGGIQGKNIRWSSEEEKALAGPIRSCSWLAGRI